MLEIEASTPKLTTNTFIIPDIAENLQPNKYTNNSAALDPTNIIAAHEKSPQTPAFNYSQETKPTL